jgi:hypothetical protein
VKNDNLGLLLSVLKLLYVLSERKLDEFQWHLWLYLFDSSETKDSGIRTLLDGLSINLDTIGSGFDVSFMSINKISKIEELSAGIAYLQQSVTSSPKSASELEHYITTMFLE